MKNNYNVEGRYSSVGFVASYPDRFWVRFDGDDTILYTGRDSGGGRYYTVSNRNISRQVKTVIDENGIYYSTRRLVSLFKNNNCQIQG